MRRFLMAVAFAGFAMPALAFHCPADIAKIDAALPTAQISEEQRAEVIKLRDEGEALHAEGKHQESVDKLAEAMKILGV